MCCAGGNARGRQRGLDPSVAPSVPKEQRRLATAYRDWREAQTRAHRAQLVRDVKAAAKSGRGWEATTMEAVRAMPLAATGARPAGAEVVLASALALAGARRAWAAHAAALRARLASGVGGAGDAMLNLQPAQEPPPSHEPQIRTEPWWNGC